MNTPTQFLRFWIYPEKPEGLKPATKTDLFRADGQPKIGTWIVLHSFRENNYQAEQIGEVDFSFDYIQPFLQANRVFIKK